MIEKTKQGVPIDHPIRTLFEQLTERGMGHSNLHDRETIQYVTNLLTDFVIIENVGRVKDKSGRRVEYLFEVLDQARFEISPVIRRDFYKHLGDLTLFNLGLFPESLTYGHRTVSQDYFADAGRRSYAMASELDSQSRHGVVYRKLSVQFEQCVVGLNWVKQYINDPFYQYMFREFHIT